MRVFILFTMCFVAATLAQDEYETESQNLNVEDLLKNQRLLISYSKCLLDKGPCTSEVRKVKEKLPEALATNCLKCTPRQKEMAKILIKEVRTSHPEIWQELKKKYDPKGQYQQAFKDLLED